MNSKSVPPFNEMFSIFANEENTIYYLELNQIIPTIVCCPRCKNPIHQYERRFRCKGHKFNQSIFKNTIFSDCHLKINIMMHFFYLYLAKCSTSSIMNILNITRTTISRLKGLFYDVIIGSIPNEYTIIGGQGIEVEIDESLFGKRKFHKGKRVNGQWVVGGVERTCEKKCFFVMVESRDAHTLFDIIFAHIMPDQLL